MAMKLIKKMADYKIFMRGDDRYAVQDAVSYTHLTLPTILLV